MELIFQQLNYHQETKYSKWYLNIIQNAKSQNRTKRKRSHEEFVYYENHHILPKSIFEEFSKIKENKWNFVLLTKKEHVVAHFCLYNYKKLGKHKEREQMRKAFYIMANNKLYEPVGVVPGSRFTETHKKNLSLAHKGKTPSKETIQKMRQAQGGEKHSQYGKPKPKYVKDKISKTLLESHPMRGKKQKTSQCPHCKKVGGVSNMVRWHFDNCKLLNKTII